MAEVIVALDLPDAATAVEFLDRLPSQCPVKVGPVLLTRAGIGFVRSLVEREHPVFLDQKWHDIPNTVRGAVAGAAELGVEMVTVHALGGSEMIRAAVEGAAGRVKVVAVTVLTSFDTAGYREATGWGGQDLDLEVERLARLAMGAGADGVGHLDSGDCGDEGAGRDGPNRGPRNSTGKGRNGGSAPIRDPRGSLSRRGHHLVVGRPILESVDPAAEYADFSRLASGVQ